MKRKPGTYVLVLRCHESRPVQIGRWGELKTRPGYYLYVGSAFGPGGLLARVSRHCREGKRKHWHIDYLREFTNPSSAWYSYGPERLEHTWAEAIGQTKHLVPIEGFGCSDCRCESHLFWTARRPGLAAFASTVGCRVESSSCEVDS